MERDPMTISVGRLFANLLHARLLCQHLGALLPQPRVIFASSTPQFSALVMSRVFCITATQI